ncbi:MULTISPECIES: hypothetical protein [Chroococcidiopsis]|nr:MULTISPECIES: hypothetical protein [Chroococcidiopsis]
MIENIVYKKGSRESGVGKEFKIHYTPHPTPHTLFTGHWSGVTGH